MNEIRYRVRRWLYGPPRWSTFTPEDRANLRAWQSLCDEHPRVVEPFTRPSGRIIHRVVPPEGAADELAFRGYARRTGERVCLGGGYTRRGVLVVHAAACTECEAVA